MGREKGPRDSDACTIIITTDWNASMSSPKRDEITPRMACRIMLKMYSRPF